MEIILPAVVAILVQWVKQHSFFDQTWRVLALTVVLSLVAAFVYSSLVAFGYWNSFVNILAYAGAIYTFVIARFES